MFSRGFLAIGRLGRAPIRIHWSAPLGALLLSGFRFVPGFWVGFLVIVLVHELGHAVLVRALRFRVTAVEVHAFGGLCWWEGHASERQHAIIAWGGVLAQAVLLVAALVVRAFAPPPSTAFTAQLLESFVTSNLWIILLNLMPIPPLDGAQAWKLLRHLRWPRRRRRAPPSPKTPTEDEVRAQIEQALRSAREEARKTRDRSVH